MSELIIRAGRNDQTIIENLLAPGTSAIPGGRRIVGRLVVDSTTAAARPDFAQVASEAAVPFLIDPMTQLIHARTAVDDSWAKLSFGSSEPVALESLDLQARDGLVKSVVDFQVRNGATAIIPAYPYIDGANGAWAAVARDFLHRTVAYLDVSDIRLPLVPILCGRLQSVSGRRDGKTDLDALIREMAQTEPSFVGLCLSPLGQGDDSYAKIKRLFDTAEAIKRTGVSTIAWHQGVYGPALVAAGLDGYETGIGTSEQTNISGSIASRKPKPPGTKGGGGGGGIYLEALGRSVSTKVGEVLLGDSSMRARVMCEDENCCPFVSKTLDDRRSHAIRTRSRQLIHLDDMPHVEWRLHDIERRAHEAVNLSEKANAVLRRANMKEQLKYNNLEALAGVAHYFGHRNDGSTGALAG